MHNTQTMLRKKEGRIIFLAHCIINQHVRAIGVKAIARSAILKPLIAEIMRENDVGIEQMPCPEILYEGLVRKACGKDRYNNDTYRSICRNVANDVIKKILEYRKAGLRIIAIVGVNGSPSCGVDFCSLGRGRWAREKGVFFEEIDHLLKEHQLDIPLIGINVLRMGISLENLRKVLLRSRLQ